MSDPNIGGCIMDWQVIGAVEACCRYQKNGFDIDRKPGLGLDLKRLIVSSTTPLSAKDGES